MYLPAEEVLSSIMGLTYSYNETTKELIVNDADLNQTLRAALDSKQAKLNNNSTANKFYNELFVRVQILLPGAEGNWFYFCPVIGHK